MAAIDTPPGLKLNKRHFIAAPDITAGGCLGLRCVFVCVHTPHCAPQTLIDAVSEFGVEGLGGCGGKAGSR